MPLCKVCFQNISVGQQMAVISYPVKNISKSGDYDFLGDFTDNQEFIHYECLRQIASKLNEILCGNIPVVTKSIMSNETVQEENPNLKEFHSTLKELGEVANKDEIREFLKENDGEDIPDLIKLWFQNRNKVTHAV